MIHGNPKIKVFYFSTFFVLVWFFLHLPAPSSGIRWLSLHNSTTNWTAVAVAAGEGARGAAAEGACEGARRAGALWEAQARVCRRQPAAMTHVVRAATHARDACLATHARQRWNCSSVELAPHYTPDLLTGTREQAFVYAMSAAALSWAVSRACAAGALAACSCAAPPHAPPRPSRAAPHTASAAPPRFKWGGCGDNFKWADRFAKAFLDAHEMDVRSGKEPAPPPATAAPAPPPAPTAPPPYVILVDDQPVADNVTTHQRGRKRLPRRARPKRKRYRYGDRASLRRNIEYRMAADDPRFDPQVDLDTRLARLRTLIATANLANGRFGRKAVSAGMYTKCTCHGVSGSCSVRTCWRALPSLARVSARLAEAAARAAPLRAGAATARRRPRLRYVTPSPDYCEPDVTAGSLGTHGRWCNASLGSAAGGCVRLCCGRGRRVVRRVRLERCRCRYHWCCRVDCQMCRTTVEEHYCN